MWLGKQQKRAHQAGEGQVGKVTIGGEQVAVLLDSERRGLEVYSPGGYQWTPREGQKVLVIQGQGEIPCVVGLRQGETPPEQVTVEADGGGRLLLDGKNAGLSGERIDLDGAVYVGGEMLEELIARIVGAMLASLG
jgi:hypothetical protein